MTVAIAMKEMPKDANVVVMSYETAVKLEAETKAKKWGLIACDEAHYLKSSDAQRTKAVIGCPAKRKNGTLIPAVPAIESGRSLFLTGTPIPNRPIELFPMLRRVDPKGLGADWYRYAVRYCDGKNDGYGFKADGSSNLGELQEKLRSACMIRRLKADVLAELPPKTRSLIAVEPTPAMLRICARQTKLVEEAAKKTGKSFGQAVRDLTAMGAGFQEMSTLRHELALAKVPLAIDMIKERLETSDKLVVFSHHRDVAKAIADAFLNVGAVLASGDETEKQRDEAKTRFQETASCRLISCTIKAFGVGHTLHAASRAFFVEGSFSPGDLAQAEDRLHRIGQLDNVFIEHMTIDGSLEARILQILVEKGDVIHSALDDAVGAMESREAAAKEASVAVASAEKAAAKSMAVAKKIEAAKQAKAEEEAALPEMPIERRLILSAMMRHLDASNMDGATVVNGAGFSKIDTMRGAALAAVEAEDMTPAQADLAARLAGKYQRQIRAAFAEDQIEVALDRAREPRPTMPGPAVGETEVFAM